MADPRQQQHQQGGGAVGDQHRGGGGGSAMGDRPGYQLGGVPLVLGDYRYQLGQPYQQQKPGTRSVAKVATAVAVGGSLLVLSGLTLAATLIGLAVAAPVGLIFSPVLVPAAITVCLLITGFLTSGGLGVAALTVLSWIYKYVRSGSPPASDQLDYGSSKLTGRVVRDVKDRPDQYHPVAVAAS